MAIEQIPVSVLPEVEEGKPDPPPKAVERARSRPAKAAVQVAKKSPPPPEETARRPQFLPERKESRQVPTRPDREKYTIVQRPLPTLKELLPPVTPSLGERATTKEGPVRLDTQDPKYVSYTTSIKRAIELVWEYPEPALRHGLQGKLVLEFTILGDGQLAGTRLVRSSGYSILDHEAVRAVQAASPFHPIPPWIGKSRLDVVASFEYHDNRLKYGVVP